MVIDVAKVVVRVIAGSGAGLIPFVMVAICASVYLSSSSVNVRRASHGEDDPSFGCMDHGSVSLLRRT